MSLISRALIAEFLLDVDGIRRVKVAPNGRTAYLLMDPTVSDEMISQAVSAAAQSETEGPVKVYEVRAIERI